MSSKLKTRAIHKVRDWILIFMWSPVLAFAVIFLFRFFGGCVINAGIGAKCSWLPRFAEIWLGNLFMFATWGWVFTIPIGAVLLLLVSAEERHAKEAKEDR